jgi:hypothetical protein
MGMVPTDDGWANKGADSSALEAEILRQVEALCQGGLGGAAAGDSLLRNAQTNPLAADLVLKRYETASAKEAHILSKTLASLIGQTALGAGNIADTLIGWMGASSELGFRASETLLLASTYHQPADKTWLRDRLMAAENDAGHPFRKSDAESVLGRLDGGFERPLEMLESKDEDLRSAAIENLKVNLDRLIIDGKSQEVSAAMRQLMPKLLNILLSTRLQGLVAANAEAALKNWAYLAPDEAIEAVLESTDSKDSEGLPNVRLAKAAVYVLTHMLPEVMPDIASRLAARIVRNGAIDFIAVNALINMGDKSIQPLLEGAKEMKDDAAFDAAILILNYSGEKGVDAVIRFCETDDPAQMLAGLRLMAGFAHHPGADSQSVTTPTMERFKEDRVKTILEKAQASQDKALADAASSLMSRLGI